VYLTPVWPSAIQLLASPCKKHEPLVICYNSEYSGTSGIINHHEKAGQVITVMDVKRFYIFIYVTFMFLAFLFCRRFLFFEKLLK